jgi:hypothetical protein
MFALPETERAGFDYFYEYTCFVAIEPARRAEYAKLAHELLKPGGMVIGCFYNHGREGGPPFDATREQVLEVFAPLFEISKFEVTPHSIEPPLSPCWMGSPQWRHLSGGDPTVRSDTVLPPV